MKLSPPDKKANPAIAIVRMLPDEAKALPMTHAFHKTGYGESLIAASPKGVSYIAFGDRKTMLDELKALYPKALFTEQSDELQQAAVEMINGEKSSVDPLPLHIKGTDFQMDVWKTLLRIPSGELTSYQHIATSIGRPKANRAVGTAVGDNPISCLIPCHRVVRSDGAPGGYHWGPDLKLTMIGKESAGQTK